jgi:hypothetical protein
MIPSQISQPQPSAIEEDEPITPPAKESSRKNSKKRDLRGLRLSPLASDFLLLTTLINNLSLDAI